MKMIVSADQNWGIGRRNQLLVSIPSDMKWFRQETTGKVVVMGRRTLESLPQGNPLKNRTNIVLTRNTGFDAKGARTVHSIEELLAELKQYKDDEIYVIGGGRIYEQLLPYCDTVHVTRLDYRFEADTWFPDLDADPDWSITAESDEQTYFDIPFTFVKYERR